MDSGRHVNRPSRQIESGQQLPERRQEADGPEERKRGGGGFRLGSACAKQLPLTERSRQQFVVEPGNRPAVEPDDGTVRKPEDGATGELTDEADDEPGVEAAGGPGAEAAGEDDTASEPGDPSEACDESVGMHRDIWGKYFENASTHFGLSLGKHQYAPVAKKKTWMASQRVRKKICVSTIPRHRAAISLNTPPMKATTIKAIAAAPVHNPPRGTGSTGGSKNRGAGGCGLNATDAPQD